MWFWQRKEVWVGNSMEEFNRVRQTLVEHGIDYDYRMNNRQRLDFNRNMASIGRMGSDPRFDTIYYLYVKKQDYENAMRLRRS